MKAGGDLSDAESERLKKCTEDGSASQLLENAIFEAMNKFKDWLIKCCIPDRTMKSEV